MSEEAKNFDLLVIGGGSGGIATARRAASYGAKVALIEASELGGTCVNRGCVPKKMFWNAAQIAEAMHDAESYGFDPVEPAFHWEKFCTSREASITRLNGIYEKNLDTDKVTLIRGWAKLIGNKTIQVDGQEYRAERIVLAPGGTPKVPAIEGADLGITSDGFFKLKQQPKRVAVVGAGYIAVEVAGVLNALGTDTTLILRKDRPLRRFDEMISSALLEELQLQGISIITGFIPEKVIQEEDCLRMEGGEGHCQTGFDQIIWAIGREALTDGLGLENEEIELNSQGEIKVNEWEETSAPGIFALGDVTGKLELTPVAIAAGRHLADRLYGDKPDAKLDYQNVPTVIFSHPPIGTVGLSEEEALKEYGDHVTCYRSRFVDMYYSLARRKVRTQMKLVTVGAEERIVGIHVIGRSADELIQGFAVTVIMGATKSDFDRTVAIHPTAAEELVTLR